MPKDYMFIIMGGTMPAAITEIYDIMDRVKKRIQVDRAEIIHLLKIVLKNDSNNGIWIRTVLNEGTNDHYISIVIIGKNAFGIKRVVGYRIEIQ